jgi:hypothetical protein
MSQFDQTTARKAAEHEKPWLPTIGGLGTHYAAGRNSAKESIHDLEVALKMYVDKFAANDFGWGNTGRSALEKVKARGDSTIEETK